MKLKHLLTALALTGGADRAATAASDVFSITVGATTVPEPAIWALMLLGFVLVGSTLRRRSTHFMPITTC